MRRIAHRFVRWNRLLIPLAVVSGLFSNLTAEAQVLDENAIKAGFLTRFMDFVEWPESKAGEPAVIGVIGSPEFLQILELACAQQRARGREVAAIAVDSRKDLKAVRIVFIVGGASIDWHQLSTMTEERSILVVGDVGTEDVLFDPQAMIQFKIIRNRIRFSVNLESAGQADLVISSKLARLAVD